MILNPDRVPATPDEAVEILDAALSDEEKNAWQSMTAAKMFELQGVIARTLRQDWSLDDDTTPLRIFFRELGLDDADEVSYLLIDAYWRRHNREAIPIEDLVTEYLEG